MKDTHDTLKNYRLYGKGPGMKTFKALNWKEGAPVRNIIFATIFFGQEATRAYHEAANLNPDWEFKLVQV